ncbi:hypothetical protein [Hymenobacter chitinivorans]|uniref:Uncharacterized protein n=1 Tax=Hymenobacter chitinivorans DSM 11115 TaxID=1121954 RepID=A0A2M9BPX8_9BACT|nr:hypothetical protein [Hymenobacter chitinivorans]PJJ59967.1 hypothetical protein CLV45_1392 [Hymenobacter chitinivorans DSM 11115]
MNTLTALLGLFGFLSLTACSSKEELPQPVYPPVNTAAVQLNGAAFPIDMTKAEVWYSPVRDFKPYVSLFIYLPTQVKNEYIGVSLDAYSITVGKMTADVSYHDKYSTAWLSSDCSPARVEVEITRFDEATKRVSGIFHATGCRLLSAPVDLTKGQFDFTYLEKL